MLSVSHQVEQPPDDRRLWRHMELASFVNVLATRSLRLNSLSSFTDDPWEGLWTDPVYEFARDTWPGTQSLDAAMRLMRTHMYASCWHQSDCESAALWKIYSGLRGVAIVTRAGTLKSSIMPGAFEPVLGCVRYFDFSKEDGLDPRHLLSAAFMKRRSFEYEKEVRLVAHALDRVGAADASFDGIDLSVDLDNLIEDVYVPPTSPRWFQEVVESLLRQFGLSGVRVSKSSIDQLR